MLICHCLETLMIAGLDKNNDVCVKTIVDSYTCFTFIWNVFVEINSKAKLSEIISYKRISSCLDVLNKCGIDY